MTGVQTCALPISILCVLYFGIRYLLDAKSDYKAQIESIKVENKALVEKNLVLEQDTANLNYSYDSVQRLINEGVIQISEERKKRFNMRIKFDQELADLQKLDDNDQVEYFIAKTLGDYPVIKSEKFYLIDINSITFANNAIVNLEYMEEEAESFIDEIVDLNQQLEYFKGQVGILNAFIDRKSVV